MVRYQAKRPTGLLAASLVVLLATFADLEASSENNVELTQVCSPKEKSIKLSTVTQAQQLIEQVRSLGDPHGDNGSTPPLGHVCNKFRDSFLDLQHLVDLQLAGKVCDPIFVDALRTYHGLYLASSSPKRDYIPTTLRRFVMVLGFQANAMCKMNVINSLEIDAVKMLNDDDWRVIENAASYIAYLFGDDHSKLRDFDDIVLLSDLIKVQEELEAEQLPKGETAKRKPLSKKVMLNVKTTKMMETMIAKCRLRYKPFYQRLVLPLIQLNNLGFDFQGELLARELEELRKNQVIRQWYSLVQLCEAVEMIELNEDNDAKFEDQRVFKLGNSHKIDGSNYVEKIVAASQEEPIKYEGQNMDPVIELWIEGHRELNQLLKRYDFSLSETDRVHKKLVRRALKTMFSKKFTHMMTDVVKKGLLGFKDKDVESSDIRATFLESLEDASDLVQKNPRLTEQVIDSQVSGVAAKAVIAARPRPIPMRHQGSSFMNQIHQYKMVGMLSDKVNLLCFTLGVIGVIFLLMSLVIVGSGR